MTVHIGVLDRTDDISRLILSAEGPKIENDSMGILAFCQQMSVETWTGYVDDRLICCWGLIPPTILSNQAYLWMHSTPEVTKHSFLIVRHSQLVIEEMLQKYPRIVGDCRVGADHSIRWLKWLGASFGESNGEFIPFVIGRKSNG